MFLFCPVSLPTTTIIKKKNAMMAKSRGKLTMGVDKLKTTCHKNLRTQLPRAAWLPLSMCWELMDRTWPPLPPITVSASAPPALPTNHNWQRTHRALSTPSEERIVLSEGCERRWGEGRRQKCGFNNICTPFLLNRLLLCSDAAEFPSDDGHRA